MCGLRGKEAGCIVVRRRWPLAAQAEIEVGGGRFPLGGGNDEEKGGAREADAALSKAAIVGVGGRSGQIPARGRE